VAVVERTFPAGGVLTPAGLTPFAFLCFGECVGQPFKCECHNMATWFEHMAGRPGNKETASV